MTKVKCAIYCRLSKDDGTSDDSSSIQTQKDALSKYAISNNYDIYDIYVDDGYSGTNFNRPAFKRMIEDIEKKCFKVILTKDLSRLSRNYLQAGFYMEDFFPKHKIRYIAVNDNYDSSVGDNEFAPFKNIINEWYAKDISKKVKYAFNNMAKEGIITTGKTPLYGYEYDDKRRRVINEETAEVIRTIFNMYIKCQSTTKIKNYLEENQIINPGYYFYLNNGINSKKYANCSEEDKYRWHKAAISRLLTNEEYTGTLICNKTKQEKLGGRKGIKTEPEERVVHHDKFEGIITRELFKEVRKLALKNKNQSIPIEQNKYRGLLVCDYCGKQLVFTRPNSKKHIYRCNNVNCKDRHIVNIDVLDKHIKNEVILLKKIILRKKEEALRYATLYSNNKNKIKNRNEDEIEVLNNKLNQVDMYIEKLLEANVTNSIPVSTYNSMMKKYKVEHEQLQERIKDLTPKYEDVNYEIYLKEFIQKLESVTDENILSNYQLRGIFTKVSIKVIKLSYHKSKVQIKFYYYKLDNLLEELMYEEQMCNIC